MRWSGGIATAVAALVIVPAAEAAAQACLGYPTAASSFAVMANVGFPEGAKTYSGALEANLAGPLAIEVSYHRLSVDDVDLDSNAGLARVAYELPVAAASVCPFGGFGYESSDVDATVIAVPVGVGIGKSIAAGQNMTATLFATPHLLWSRVSMDILGEEFEESDTSFGADLGARLGMRRFFVGASVAVSSVEDSDAVFSVGGGFVLGGN